MRAREYLKLFTRFERVIARHFTPRKEFLQHKQHWFPAKRYGWGWGVPVCWEGRAIVLIYMITLAQGARFVEDSPHLALLLTGCATTWLVGVCFWKGEKPQWRWDKDS
jgi:hypothetical protein